MPCLIDWAPCFGLVLVLFIVTAAVTAAVYLLKFYSTSLCYSVFSAYIILATMYYS